MSKGVPAPELALARLAALVEERLGLRFHEGNADFLQRGLLRIGAGDPYVATRLYVDLADSPIGQPAWQRVISELTVGETYFFRHPEDFAVLRRHVVPALLGAGHTQLRAWSAGCATGEEAYSLAICLCSVAPATSVEVLGTDLNQACLTVAEKGFYGARSLRDALPSWESALPHAEGGQRLVPSDIRSRVRFAVHNLAEPHPPVALGPAGCHVIFCRNVLIYFGQNGAAQVLAKLAQSLAPGGYLFVSPLDLTHCVPELEPLELDGSWLFRKALPRTPAPVRSRATPGQPAPADKPQESPDPVRQARLAADRGDLATATEIARQALRHRRTPEALHLLALILGEQGQHDEMRQLLEEAVATSPGYVQGHLSLGLQPAPGPHKWRAAHHLATVVSLLEGRPDDDILPGPESLPVTLARRLAEQALHGLRSSDGPQPGERRDPPRTPEGGESR
jgi:chemotaxis methyl-accepting protein methylase